MSDALPDDQIATLRATAEAANDWRSVQAAGGGPTTAKWLADRRFEAEVTPPTVLALLDEVTALRAKVAAVEAVCSAAWRAQEEHDGENRLASAAADALRTMTRQVRAALTGTAERCCDLHNRNCEPPSELCCWQCTEGAHPLHLDGSECIAPDLSGTAETSQP